VDFDSIRVARAFTRIDTSTAFDPDNPYQFMIPGESLGILLFNPAGYHYEERFPNGQRLPLVARVNYDVYDWRILREDFRVPDIKAPATAPGQYALRFQSLKHKGSTEPDGKSFAGMGIYASDGSGSTENKDFILMDLQTGAIFASNAYNVDRSKGLITFLDKDGDTTNGIQSDVIMPGSSTTTVINSSGRSVRALYEANGEWAVQVLKSPSAYRGVSAMSMVQAANFYPAGTAEYLAGTAIPSDTKIYFPRMDIGQRVTISEVWYHETGSATGTAKALQDQDFVITADNGMGVVDVGKVVTADQLDYSHGYSVRGVKGASMFVRVLWNTDFLHFNPDPVRNGDVFDTWSHNWHKVTTETYLSAGGVR
jgi:hypothetical protein